ncbi:MAG: glycosyltransferase family 2 protein [Gammaproteobacteria bacterium]|nr:glycosyltransferase family 2 protein [Gammaproteobacteria bacterium]MCD8573757.1 glycosyltransferase family 2 protein [Gammaproteobacteria bacterium]
MIELSIVIPAYNEQENLPTLVQGIMQALSEKATFEIVIVDDASTDDTQNICRQLKEKHPHLTYLRHVKNSGQSASVYTGVRHARFSLIATLDGDGQNPPTELEKLLAAHRSYVGCHEKTLFAGHRQKRQDPWIKRISSKIANKIRGSLLKDNCPDTGCGLKLFHQKAFLTLPHFNHMHRFLPALYKRNGFSVMNVPIQHAPRQFGVSKYNTWGRLRVGIIDLFGVAWLARRPCHPMTEENTHE